MEYAANFSVTIKNKHTISLFDTGATISCMSKACLEKLQPKLALVQTHAYKVSGANGDSLSPLRTTICTIKFPKKTFNSNSQFVNTSFTLFSGLDFSHNYLIGIDWFPVNQLHLHQGL